MRRRPNALMALGNVDDVATTVSPAQDTKRVQRIPSPPGPFNAHQARLAVQGNQAVGSCAMGNCCPHTCQVSHRPPSPPKERKPSITLMQIKLKYSKQDKELMDRFLKDFGCCEDPASQHDVLVLRDHWDKLHVFNHKSSCGEQVAPVDKLFDVFYAKLFVMAPQLRAVFRNSVAVQEKALKSMVSGMRSIIQSDDVVANAAAIAERHLQYGVRCEHLSPVGVVLLHSLQEAAPELWSAQVAYAWRAVYGHVAVLLLAQMERLGNLPKQVDGPSGALAALGDGEVQLHRCSSETNTAMNGPKKPAIPSSSTEDKSKRYFSHHNLGGNRRASAGPTKQQIGCEPRPALPCCKEN